MKETLRRLKSLITRDRFEDGLSEEIRFHIDQQTEKNIRAGMNPQEARRLAYVKFGGVEKIKESTRDEFRASLIEDFARDLRYGARVLRCAPGFALVSILTLGLGIGAATAVFTVVDGVLLRPLPYPDPDRIVRLFQLGTENRRMNVSEPNFLDWKSGTRSFRALAEIQVGPAPVAPVFAAASASSERINTMGAAVSREFFDVIGVRPAIGRLFQDDELHVNATPVAIISHQLWSTRFNGAPLDGLSLRIEDRVVQVVGIMPPGFDFPAASQYWFPRELRPPQTSRTAHNFQVVARIADGVSLETAQADLSSVSRALKSRYGDATWMEDAVAIPLREQVTQTAKPTLWLLFGASVLLLLIACLNVSNLQLARASTRQRELAVRLAIGAGRGRITRQMMAEALVLAVAAGIVGIALAFAGVRALVALQPANLPRIDNVQVDAWVLAFALGVALITAMALGVVTSLRTSQAQLRDALNLDQRTMAGGRERVRQALVVAQVALTIVLLAGAGLLARSFIRLLEIDPGFRTDNATILDLTWSSPPDESAGRRLIDTQDQMLQQLGELPGVAGVGLINNFPLGGFQFPNGRFLEMTRPDEIQSQADVAKLQAQIQDRAGFAGFRVASAGYFRTMGIPLLRGRLFEESDGPDAPHVAVISESLANTKWPDRDPIGRFVQFGNMDGDLRGFRIVGIVGDVREVSTEALPGPTFYGHYRQRLASRVSIVLREVSNGTSEGPGFSPGEGRQLIRDIDPEATLNIRSVEEALDRTLANRRFSLLLIGVFSVSALILAMLGIYGLMAYVVAQRTREIGIRMALGAASTDVTRLIVGKGVLLALIGATVGLIASLGLTQVLEGMLFGITATDPVALGSVVALTVGAVLVAAYVPARRAVRIMPVTALRAD